MAPTVDHGRATDLGDPQRLLVTLPGALKEAQVEGSVVEDVLGVEFEPEATLRVQLDVSIMAHPGIVDRGSGGAQGHVLEQLRAPVFVDDHPEACRRA